MTKKNLLETFEAFEAEGITESRLDKDYGNMDEKLKLVREHLSQIKDILTFCPEDLPFDGRTSFKVFETKETFKKFVSDSSVEDIKIQLKAIEFELKSLADSYEKGLNGKTNALIVRNDWLNDRQEKNHKIVFPIFIALFAIFSVAVFAFAILDSAKVFAEGSAMAKTCSIATAVAGAFDIVTGVGFFIYEKRDDRKKRNNQAELDEALTGKRIIKNSGNVIKGGKGTVVNIGDEALTGKRIIKNSGNVIKSGKGTVVNIGDVGVASEVSQEELLNAYIVKNSYNKINGKSKEINIGDRKY